VSLADALEHFVDYIKSETLAISLAWVYDDRLGAVESVEINGTKADVQLRVAG
jgi:hypothetical protein